MRTNTRCVHLFLLMRIHCSQNNYSTLTRDCNVNFVYILCTYQRQSHLYISGSGLETFLSCIWCWPTGMRQLHHTSTSPPHFIFVLKLTSIGIFDFWPEKKLFVKCSIPFYKFSRKGQFLIWFFSVLIFSLLFLEGGGVFEIKVVLFLISFKFCY